MARALVRRPTTAVRSDDVETVSFEEAFDAELAGELGDLGPAGRSVPTIVAAAVAVVVTADLATSFRRPHPVRRVGASAFSAIDWRF